MDSEDQRLERAETQANDYFSQAASPGPSFESEKTVNDISRHPTHVDRWHSQVLQHSHTVGGARSNDTEPLPVFGAGKSYPPDIPADRESFTVDFTGPDDPFHPQNWPTQKKLINAALGAFTCFCSTFASSVISPTVRSVSAEFGISIEVTNLVSTLYLCGYAVGPSIWAPLSELRGRRLPMLIGSFGFSIFAIAVAVAKDVQTLMICRFFMGVFGSAPLVVVAGIYGDIFKAEVRGLALVIFCCNVFLGPMNGPYIGAFTDMNKSLGWRFTSWWCMSMGFGALIAMTFFLKESYPPIILVEKAEYLRRRTRNWGIHAKQEEVEIDLREMLTKNISRPIRMLFEEPILLLVGFYITFVYSLLYISFTAYPEVFYKKHHFNLGVTFLTLFGMMVGIFSGAVVTCLANPSWVRKYHANGNRAEPEWRLPVVAVSGVVFAIGLFWFGWTGNYPSVHWIVPTIGGAFIGFGIIGVFIGLINYIIDAYLMFAASAIAGNTILRSLVAASCPLYDTQMFNNMGVEWGMTLLGCFALIMIPVPMLFIKYGPALRKKSKWAPNLPAKPATPRKSSTPAKQIGLDDGQGEEEKEKDTQA